jgi:hypothetical protein
VAGPRHYCSLFDATYLPRALALYRSLERWGGDFVLHAVCMDDESRRLLEALALPRVRLAGIADVEERDPELVAVRPSRSVREYFWTATPAVCRFVLGRTPEIDVLTYLDADLCFSSSPEPLFAELGAGSVLIVPHRSPDEGTRVTGIYNVGWVSFRNDAHGNAALAWWRERCLEWCHDRIEPGRFGDQKYLDDWPERFPGVRVCADPAAGVAPWNDESHALTVDGDGRVRVDGTPLIFYHHAGLRPYRGEAPSARLASLAPRFSVTRTPVRLVWSVVLRPPPARVRELIWRPYVQRLAEAHAELLAVGAEPTIGLRPTMVRMWVAEIALRRVPSPARSAYRRMPAGVRGQVARVLAQR